MPSTRTPFRPSAHPALPPPIPGPTPAVMSVQFGLEHPVPVASSCCWPQPSLFSWHSENAWGPGGVVERTILWLLCVLCSEVRVSASDGGGVRGVWENRGPRKENSWVPDNGRCRVRERVQGPEKRCVVFTRMTGIQARALARRAVAVVLTLGARPDPGTPMATGLSRDWGRIRSGRPLAAPSSVGVGRSSFRREMGEGSPLPPSCGPYGNR